MCESLCRICAKNIQEKNALKLFESQNRKLLLQIKDLTGVKLKNSLGLPKLMCLDCKRDLIDAYKFREDFLKVQASFKIKTSRGNKKQNSNCVIEATEFVQVFIVKEEKNITISDHEDLCEEDENEEKEINIAASQELNQKQILQFDKVDCEEINALEINPNEENTLEDTKISTEDNLDDLGDDTSKIVNAGGESISEGSEEISSATKGISRSKKLKPINKNTDNHPSSEECDGNKIEITKPRKKRKDTEENPNIFICDQCGNHFSCRHHFKLHLRRHSGDKRCACELCPDKFFTSSELRRHMRRHTGERPFACKFCDRRFTDYSTRIKHERIHTNERPFMCSQCGKSFTTSYILKNHMLTHTGERHFKCDVCNKAFTRRTHLVVHFRSIMHKQAVEKDKRPISQEELPQPHCIIPQATHISTFLV